MSQQPVIASVIIDLPVRELNRVFDYLVPPHLSSKVTVGTVVVVPFGRTKQVGYVVGFNQASEVEKLLGIEAVVNERPVFDENMVELCRWIAKYYLSTLSEALRLAIPAGQGSKIAQMVKIVGEIAVHGQDTASAAEARLKLPPAQAQAYQKLIELGGDASAEALKAACGGKSISAAVSKLCQHRMVERYYSLERPRVKEAIARYAVLSSPLSEQAIQAEFKKSPKQRRILEELLRQGEAPVVQLLGETKAPYSSLRALQERGLVRIEERTVTREPETHFEQKDKTVTLTGEQDTALLAITKAIKSSSHEVFLLQGVTGSGKTEVYLRSIQKALDMGKSAIVLVPEIALTAQVVARFKARFHDIVAVFHSALGAGERFDQWRGIQEGRYRVVVGARSAVFAPLSRLGIVVVDEEHESSYKQGRSPRYSAREVAIKRAELEGACVVLGSATPSLEAKWRSETGQYRPLFLHKRAHQKELPRVEVVDMREEPHVLEGDCLIRPLLGVLLRHRLEETLKSGGKAILFLNRRGFSNFIICEACGFVAKCKNCAVSLTYHSVNNSLRCHHCNFAARSPKACPKCGKSEVRFPGSGTQRVESELSALYPGVPVIRMDADTTSRKGAHQKRLAKFDAEKSAVLLGTQMIAKGLDFPEVTLVGVINADTSLNLPDFRAFEHTFQLLMQVSGRAGRGEQPGTVVIQTMAPDSEPIQAVLAGSYDSFYRDEVEHRRELFYPPFSSMVRLLFTGEDPKAVVGLAKSAARIIEDAKLTCKASAGSIEGNDRSASRKIQGLSGAFEMVGPSPAPLLKVKGEYRWHILLKVRDNIVVKRFLEDNFSRFVPDKYQKVVVLTIDIDPYWVL